MKQSAPSPGRAPGRRLGGCRGGDTETGESGVKTDVGVTSEPCPEAVNKDKGCIYLGIISDLTEGPFRALAVPITDAQKAFWKRVNTPAVSATTRSTSPNTSATTNTTRRCHNQVYQEIKPQHAGAGADPGLADDGGHPARHEGQQRGRLRRRRGPRRTRSRT